MKFQQDTCAAPAGLIQSVQSTCVCSMVFRGCPRGGEAIQAKHMGRSIYTGPTVTMFSRLDAVS
jgi:hypothetical protein